MRQPAQAIPPHRHTLRENRQSLPLNAMHRSSKALDQNCQHGLASRPNSRAAEGSAFSVPSAAAYSGSRTAPTRENPCTASRSSSSLLPTILASLDNKNPVTLPPGRAKLSTSPSATGSSTLPNQIKGVVPVTFRQAKIPGVDPTTITAGLSATRSATSTGKRSALDLLVGEQLQCVGHLNAEQSCRLQIDDQLELGRLHDRQVTRLRSFEDLTGVNADLTKHVQYIGSITHQPARFDELAQEIGHGNPMMRRERRELDAPAAEEPVGADEERFGPVAH